MYDELIHTEIGHYGIDPPIKIFPEKLAEVITNFESEEPNNIILTGTEGDGKTYNFRLVWEHFNGDPQEWRMGIKVAKFKLPNSGKCLNIVKDLSKLTT